jgi:membrane-associated phospholipid phosphatase
MTIRLACGISIFALLSLPASPVLAQEPVHEPSPARRLVKTLTDDLKSLASTDTFPLVLATGALAMTVWPYDAELTYRASNSTFLKTMFDPWARIVGQEWMLAGGALATFTAGRMFDHPKVAALGTDLMEAEAIAGTTTLALKLAVHRTRPDGEPRSFPSGHASGVLAAATVIQRHFGWKIAIPVYTGAALVSGARLQANSHYATDLIVGAAVGILAGRAATFDLGPRRVNITPGVTPGGFSINGTIH